MFEVGSSIIYGNSGVCKIVGIGAMSGMPKDKLYYTLEPYYVKGSRIFTPVDNTKVTMRPVITKQDALTLVDEMKEIEALWIPDEKHREQEYKDALKSCDCRQLVKVIKTIYCRKSSREAAGKKLTSSDERFFHQAEERLYGELAISLDMSREEVKDYIVNRITELEV